MGAPGRCWLGREGSSDGEAGGGQGRRCRPRDLSLWCLENGIFSVSQAVRSSDESQACDQ